MKSLAEKDSYVAAERWEGPQNHIISPQQKGTLVSSVRESAIKLVLMKSVCCDFSKHKTGIAILIYGIFMLECCNVHVLNTMSFMGTKHAH